MLNRRIVAEGALEEVLTAENLARTFSTNTADAQLVASEEAQR